MLPPSVWQHVFPAGRQLPHLTSLNVSNVGSDGDRAVTLDSSLLVSCCPSLQSLDMHRMPCTFAQLAPLQGLSSLHNLLMELRCDDEMDVLAVVGHMTALRSISLEVAARLGSLERGLLLAPLQQLTQLTYHGPCVPSEAYRRVAVTSAVSPH
jgi:hypothetical protein